MPLNLTLLDEYLAKCTAFETRGFPPTKEEKAELDKFYLSIVDSDRCAKESAVEPVTSAPGWDGRVVLDSNNDSYGRRAA